MAKYTGELEIDEKRGVLYFHDHGTGRTILRVCRLEPEKLVNIIMSNISSIDITLNFTSLVGYNDDFPICR